MGSFTHGFDLQDAVCSSAPRQCDMHGLIWILNNFLPGVSAGEAQLRDGGAHQDARPKLSAPVPPSAWLLLAAAVMLDGDQPQHCGAVGEHTTGWELQIF